VQVGLPSFVAGASGVEPTKIAQVRVVEMWPTQAVHPSPVRVIVGPVTPVVVRHTLGGKLSA
jgi:hypothetical protein